VPASNVWALLGLGVAVLAVVFVQGPGPVLGLIALCLGLVGERHARPTGTPHGKLSIVAALIGGLILLGAFV
jgi:hypothetical protein